MRGVILSVVLLVVLQQASALVPSHWFLIPSVPKLQGDPRCSPNALFSRIALWYPLKDTSSIGKFAYDYEGQRMAYLLDVYNHTTMTTTQHMVMDYKKKVMTTLEAGKCTFTPLKDPMIHMCSSPDDTLLGEVRVGEREMTENIMAKRDDIVEFRVMTKDKYYPVAIHHLQPDNFVEMMFSDVNEGIDEKLFTVACPRE